MPAATDCSKFPRVVGKTVTSNRQFERELVRTETLVVEGRIPDGRALTGYSRNLSLSGIFVETETPVTEGTEVQLFIGSYHSPLALRVVAPVVRSNPGIGFGGRFVDATDDGRNHVAAFLRRFRQPR